MQHCSRIKREREYRITVPPSTSPAILSDWIIACFRDRECVSQPHTPVPPLTFVFDVPHSILQITQESPVGTTTTTGRRPYACKDGRLVVSS